MDPSRTGHPVTSLNRCSVPLFWTVYNAIPGSLDPLSSLGTDAVMLFAALVILSQLPSLLALAIVQDDKRAYAGLQPIFTDCSGGTSTFQTRGGYYTPELPASGSTVTFYNAGILEYAIPLGSTHSGTLTFNGNVVYTTKTKNLCNNQSGAKAGTGLIACPVAGDQYYFFELAYPILNEGGGMYTFRDEAYTPSKQQIWCLEYTVYMKPSDSG
ncbi:hypothetical protein BD324DRAFT_619712 [Kockovaella imperatae]|uniref:Phosphatidylglycerol/phosphatidylinositol transfer protein n=1 Tax=Kockovaella imperatae TaxID=4999 RepID=A0A1Y1UN47_9TREE|nr:hypothetical protein BD324DRAFT_619712 [Kockovaella imperatae]ORX39439.1 hypothetical protein BD324DRAFT_619712 [Kockovaella imperatae]